MKPITLQTIPNQTITATLDGLQYVVTLRSIADMVYMTVSIGGVVIIEMIPCIVGQLVIPYPYLEGSGGNFVWTTASGGNPQYTNFAAGDVLLYVSAAELVAYRASIAAARTTITLASNQAG